MRFDSEETPSSQRESDARDQLTLMHAHYRASLERSEATELQLRASERLLVQAREKIRSLKRKKTEADYYRSLLHRLRSRWYLRPFISRQKVEPPDDDFLARWCYHGPRFEVSSSASGPKHRHRRVLIVGHLLNRVLFGSEKSLLEMITAIDSDRFDVFVVFPQKNDQVFARLRPYVQGIAVLDYVWWRKDRPFDEDVVSAFERICRQQAIDLVHANTIMLSDPLIAAQRVGIPSITNARELISLDQELADRLGGSPAEIVRTVCENATYVLANSAATLADYPCGNRGGYLHNGIDGCAFDLPNITDAHSINVGLVSSNIPKKGIFDFLELAFLAEDRLPTLQFHLVGPKNDLIEGWWTGTSSLPRNFHLRDFVAHPPDAYRGLNIVLNLSRFAESFGRTVAEAMAARRPVIAYRYGALPELIDEGETGFLVPYLDLQAILQRLQFFVEAPEKISQFGETARARIMERCSPAFVAREINALYDRLITGESKNLRSDS